MELLPESSLLKKRVARIYLFTFRYFSPFKRRSKYKKHNKEFNSFKLTYYSDTSVEQHKLYHDFDENVYVKPDLKKISSLAREEEPDLMSDRQTIKAAGYRVSIEDFLNEIKKPSYGAIFIRGAAGFGKSNLCSHIAYSLSKEIACCLRHRSTNCPYLFNTPSEKRKPKEKFQKKWPAPGDGSWA